MEKLKKRRDAARAFKEMEAKHREIDSKGATAARAAEGGGGPEGGGAGAGIENPLEDRDDFSVDAGPRARQRRLALEFKRINGGSKKQQQQQGSQLTTEDPSGFTRRLSSRSDSTLSVGFGFGEGDRDGDGDDNQSLRSQQSMSTTSKSNQPTIYHSLSTETQQTHHTAIESLLNQKTDMLEWDRQEREQEMDLMQAMVKYGGQVREETKRVVRQAAKETAKNTAVNVSTSAVWLD
jgi:preprotein translocase subunit SecE